MSPRYLGCKLVIARSFARLHITNLKKQGVLPCTFATPGDFEKVRAGDTVSVHGLAALAPAQPLSGILHHTDGANDPMPLNHFMTEEQIRWFRAGAALNLMKNA